MRKLPLCLLMIAGMIMAGSPAAKADSYEQWYIASWNIGHFSLGNSNKTTIAYGDYDKMRAEYTDFIDRVNVDLLVLVEYSTDFAQGISTTARKAILSKYETAAIGPTYSYNCNAVFCNGYTTGTPKVIDYEKMVQHRYMYEVPIYVNGDTILVVATHLDWNQSDNGKTYRKYQMEELIKRYGKKKYILICGDWNTDSGEFQTMQSGGFTLLNCGTRGNFLTYPASNPTRALDNIVMRGFGILSVYAYTRADLSDHSLIKGTLYRKNTTAADSPFLNPEQRVNISGSQLFINGAFSRAEVYTADGRLVYAGTDSYIMLPNPGTYIVRIDGKSVKVSY